MAEPVDILIEKGTVLTLDGERRILTDGAIAIKGDRIAAVGKTADVRKKYEGKKTIDASTRLIMPGLVDGHSHLIEIARGLIPDTLKTSDWLKFWCYPYLAAITEEDEYWLFALPHRRDDPVRHHLLRRARMQISPYDLEGH